MSTFIGSAAGAPTPVPPQSEAERLRGVARDLEGVFVEQLFKAMRETVPEGGVVDGGSGEEMFTGLLDQRLSAQVPARWEHGLAEALYRQLRGAAGVAEPASAPPATTPATASAAPAADGAGSAAPVDSSLRAHGPILGSR